MKDIYTLLWQKTEDESCETGQTEGKMFDELHTKYLQPNDAIFEENYRKNCPILNTVGYDKCTLDFIPITGKEYVMVDSEKRYFCGTFAVKPYVEDSSVEKSIFSVLIADEWDIRKMMPAILEKRWNYIYFVLNEETKKFASFFKLEGFLSTLPPNVKFFATTEEMRQYFLDDHDAYLPKRIIAPEPEKYEALFKDIHDARIQSGIPSNNVFLSICIPTQNRGSRALKTVKHILETQYDAEIAVVVANNGSVSEKEDYERIRDLKDSRVRYYEFEHTETYTPSFYNVLSKACGHFGFILSDEDELIVDRIGEVLEWLIRNNDISICSFSSDNVSMRISKAKRFKKGIEAVKEAVEDLNYCTGSCYNLDSLKAEGIFEEANKYSDNKVGYAYFIGYGYHLPSIILGAKYDYCNTGIIAWNYEKSESHGGTVETYQRDDGIASYTLPEERWAQFEGSIAIAQGILTDDDFKEFFSFRFNQTFAFCSVACKYYGTKYEAVFGSWLNVWKMGCQSCRNSLEKYGLENNVELKEKLKKTLIYWIICKRLQKLHTPEENLLPSLQAQVVKYYCEQGTPIEDIDFDQIEKDLEGWVQSFLEKRK